MIDKYWDITPLLNLVLECEKEMEKEDATCVGCKLLNELNFKLSQSWAECDCLVFGDIILPIRPCSLIEKLFEGYSQNGGDKDKRSEMLFVLDKCNKEGELNPESELKCETCFLGGKYELKLSTLEDADYGGLEEGRISIPINICHILRALNEQLFGESNETP